jgi:AcrR family transcriptional regulator
MPKAERTKRFIVEKTAPLFNTKGYAGTSLTDMTEATGLTKGSIYGNFENKDEVALAAFDHNFRCVREVIRGEMGKRPDALGKLLVYADVYEHYLKHPFPEGGCPILNTAIEADDTHPALRRKAVAALHSWRKDIAALIALGIKAREIAPGTDPEGAAFAIVALIEGGLMMAKLTGRDEERKAMARAIGEYIRGLA